MYPICTMKNGCLQVTFGNCVETWNDVVIISLFGSWPNTNTARLFSLTLASAVSLKVEHT